jgi:hypothetical protein
VNVPTAARGIAGSALVEALVALVLIAVAGAMVASAAAAGLRASSRAATLTRTTTLAARELAFLANGAALAASADSTLAVAGFADPLRRTVEATRDGTIVALAVHVDAGRPPERVTLATRVLTPP